MDSCGSFPLLSAPHSLFSIWTDFKNLKRSQWHQCGVRRVDWGNLALRTSPKFTTGVKISYQFHQSFWPDQRSGNFSNWLVWKYYFMLFRVVINASRCLTDVTRTIPSCRPRWSRGYHTRHWIRGSRVQTRPGSMDFFQSVKILKPKLEPLSKVYLTLESDANDLRG